MAAMQYTSALLPDELVGMVASFMSVKTLLRLSLSTRELQFGFVWDQLHSLDAHFDCNDGKIEMSEVSRNCFGENRSRVVEVVSSLLEHGVQFKSLQKVNLYAPFHDSQPLDDLKPLLRHLSSQRRLKSVTVHSSQLRCIQQVDIEELTVFGIPTARQLRWFQNPLPKLRSLRFIAADATGQLQEIRTFLVTICNAPKNVSALEKLTCIVQPIDAAVDAKAALNVWKYLSKIYKSSETRINTIAISQIIVDALKMKKIETDSECYISQSVIRFVQSDLSIVSPFSKGFRKFCESFRRVPYRKHSRNKKHLEAVESAEHLRDIIYGSIKSPDYVEEICNITITLGGRLFFREEWYIDECSRILATWKVDPFCSIDKILKLVVLSASLMYQYCAPSAQNLIQTSCEFLLEFAPDVIGDIPDGSYMGNIDSITNTILRDVILDLEAAFQSRVTLRLLIDSRKLLRKLQLPSWFVTCSLRINSWRDTLALLHIGADPFWLLYNTLRSTDYDDSLEDWEQDLIYLLQAIEDNVTDRKEMEDGFQKLATRLDGGLSAEKRLPKHVEKVLKKFSEKAPLDDLRAAINRC